MHSARSLARKWVKFRDPPKDGTVSAFVEWMQELGEAREFDLFDAYEFYESTCAILGHRQMTRHKHFKDAMRQAGCEVRRGDEVVAGNRRRALKVRIPAATAKTNP